jgi:hypothetical protein
MRSSDAVHCCAHAQDYVHHSTHGMAHMGLCCMGTVQTCGVSLILLLLGTARVHQLGQQHHLLRLCSARFHIRWHCAMVSCSMAIAGGGACTVRQRLAHCAARWAHL